MDGADQMTLGGMAKPRTKTSKRASVAPVSKGTSSKRASPKQLVPKSPVPKTAKLVRGTPVRGAAAKNAAGPERSGPHQLTIPALDSPLLGDIQNGRQIMMHSYFAHTCSKTNSTTELPTYDDGKIRIEVRGTKIGVATIDDAEILLYCLSLAGDKLSRGERVGQEFTFTLKDFCHVSGLSQSGSVSKRLGEALERLKETNIKTNIEAGGKVYVEGFSWVEKYWYDKGTDQLVKGKKRSGKINSITVRFCDFLWRAITIDRNLLSYSREFFTLSPLKRRLYEIARVHCNDRPAFRIGLESLRDRVGTAQELKKFKDDLVKILDESDGSPLPGYTFRIDTGQAESKRPRLSKTAVEFWSVGHEISKSLGDIPMIDSAYLLDLRPAA
jgi:hypothetical protein